jgi:glycosyltransferase involved in cell wall biosynthesis
MEQSALLLLVELKAMGHEVQLLSLNELGALSALLAKHDIPAAGMTYRGLGGWRTYLPLRRRLKSIDVDAVIMTGHNLIGMLALSGLSCKRRILTWHYHHRGVKASWMWRLIYRVAAAQFSAIVYPSRYIADEALEVAPRVRDMQIVLSYPFSVPPRVPEDERLRLRQKARTQFGLTDKSKVIGNAGWLIPRKRWDVFLQVSALVAKEVDDLKLLIAGDGVQKAALQRLASKLDIADNIRWLGWQEDLTLFYHAIDALLFNSDWDAMGRTPLESMAHGIPTIASVVNGGLGEVLNDPGSSVFLSTHDVPTMAAKLIELLQNPQAASQMGAKGRQCIIEVGSPRRHAERVLELLESSAEVRHGAN